MNRSPLTLAILTALALPSVAAAAPSDPAYPNQQPPAIIRESLALDLLNRSLVDIPVFIAANGLDLDHPDLVSRLFSLPGAVPAPAPEGGNPGTVQAGAPGWDLIGNANSSGPLAPDPDPNHPPFSSADGTLVAGALGAAQSNGIGGAGVAPNARFIALRSCWDADECFEHVQASAVDWAADRGARVVVFHTLFSPLQFGLQTSIPSHPNVLFVTIPSGNGGAFDADPGDPQPCAFPSANVLCVSTSSPSDGLDCGAYGPQSVDVAVPTQSNLTTVNGGGFTGTPCATSYASPIAGGVATILFGLDPTASAADVKSAIVDSARPAGAWSGRSVSGGILDAAGAVALFQARRGIVRPPVKKPLPPPVLGRQFNVVPKSGGIYVSLPAGKSSPARAAQYKSPIKGRRFVPLSEARQIPIGSFVDVRKGTAALTTASTSAGKVLSGDFSSGVFQVLQSRNRKTKGLTELRLKGSTFAPCKPKRGKGSTTAQAAKSKRKIRSLRGNAKGRFRTRGRYSAATVRGTRWTTTDRCDGTLTAVQRGRVDVRDFRRRKTIKLRTGKRYLAKAP